MVVWDVFQRNWVSKGPRTLMLLHQFEDILAFQQKGHFLCFYKLVVILPSPATFLYSWYVQRVYSEFLLFP